MNGLFMKVTLNSTSHDVTLPWKPALNVVLADSAVLPLTPDAMLFAQVLDEVQLTLVHPAGNRDQHKAERIFGPQGGLVRVEPFMSDGKTLVVQHIHLKAAITNHL
jgi:hypothetical protein